MNEDKSKLSIGVLLEKVADQMLEGMQVIDREWRYLYVNETVAKQGHRRKDELIGRTMIECYPGIEKTELFIVLQKSMSEQIETRMENEFTYPDGKKGWFQLFIQPVKEGILIFSMDISNQKRAEMELQKKMAEFEQLTKTMAGKEKELLKQEIADLKDLVSQMIATKVYQAPIV